ncbi:MAG: [protein-PII] uridylyltransferase [Halieaceae bacterium MED-G26]|nr:MAG: [protein-PII] uridylyltransferase [Halieaceae bacterium MED-G26]|tara:strand:+ start:5071 stop:7680 length:2610 start_codon:yes stop_codon:yes gene_type:complete
MDSKALTTLVSQLRSELSDVAGVIGQQFEASAPVTPLLEQRCSAVDQTLTQLWNACALDKTDIALIAVGGYGRGELFPSSDVDLLILLGQPNNDSDAQVSAFVSSLWDLGLKIGHSVRSIDECLALAVDDITVMTTLLETRLLVGPSAVYDKLLSELDERDIWKSGAFFTAKLEEQTQRHEKYGLTGYSLEPNVKSSPGGLRDIQVIGWIARRHFGSALERLPTGEFLTEQELDLLMSGQDYLSRVRFALHHLTGRDEDRLLFEHQQTLARLWGFEDGGKLAVEQFMQAYFRNVQAVSHVSALLVDIYQKTLLQAETSSATVIDEDFELIDDRISARQATVFTHNPSNLLRLFAVIGRDKRIKRIDPETTRLLRASADLIDKTFREDPVNRRLFRDVLSSPYSMTKQLRRMLRHGVLGRYLPEFEKIVGQMQFDMFHAYTVDAHTMQVIANSRRFLRADYTDRFPVTTRIAQRLRNPLLLFVAALYHDIGKGRGGDHSQLGAVDARLFCERHFFDEPDTELVVWLVKNHLFMSSFSQKRDISDPREIQRFAEHMSTEERLDYLFTLTVADINGTNPELWNAWRSSLLRHLYTETRRALRRGLANPLAREDVIAATKKAAAHLLEFRGFLDDELDSIWAARGNDYFLRERPEDIAWHTEAIADFDSNGTPLILLKQSSESLIANATQIFVHTANTSNVFSRVCSALELLDLSINDARIYSGTDGATLDTFFVLKADGTPVDSDPDTLHLIETAIFKALTATSISTAQQRITRTLRSFLSPTAITFIEDEGRNLTIMEISSPDRPGLLAQIGQILDRSNIAIQAAKIQTLGERVEDVFFLTNTKGNRLDDAATCELLRVELCEALDKDIAA